MKAIFKTKELAKKWLEDNGVINMNKCITHCACGETQAYTSDDFTNGASTSKHLIAGVCEACGDDPNEGDFIHIDRR